MTKLGHGSVTRETDATYMGRPLVVTIKGETLEIREKGRRGDAAVAPLSRLFVVMTGWNVEAQRAIKKGR